MHFFRRENVGEVLLITLEIQSLDGNNSREVSRRVTEAIGGSSRVVVDLGALRYFDVTGFAELLVWAGGGPHKAEVRFCSQSGTVRALFELLRAPMVVPLYRSFDDAMASLHRPERKSAEVITMREEDRVLPGKRIA
jgi:anti-anti-sigma regulatory factor